MNNCCPVCGWTSDWHRAPYIKGSASFDICPCCRFEYGFSDDLHGYTFELWRWLWIKNGAPFASRQPHEGYDAATQLAGIGLDLEYYRRRQDRGDAVADAITSALPRFRRRLHLSLVRRVIRRWHVHRVPDELRDEHLALVSRAAELIEQSADVTAIESHLELIKTRMSLVCLPGDLRKAARALHRLELADVTELWGLDKLGRASTGSA